MIPATKLRISLRHAFLLTAFVACCLAGYKLGVKHGRENEASIRANELHIVKLNTIPLMQLRD